jgi:hypothetical protein
MIVQMEAILLHTLESQIISHGGFILDRNTDAIRYQAPTPFPFETYFWDKEQKAPKYQSETPLALQFERLPKFTRKVDDDFHKIFGIGWNTQLDYDGFDSADWKEKLEEEAKRIAESKKGVFINGDAGTGKSFLVNAIKKNIVQKMLVLAPTNISARLIGGQTIQSLYFKFGNNRKVFKKLLLGVEYIFIDEISMVHEKFFQLFQMIKRMFPEIIFIISGDFRQLPPVEDSWTGDYENSEALRILCNYNKIVLTKCRRADDELFNLCKESELKKLVVPRFATKERTMTNLAFTHATRIKVNNDCMLEYIKAHPQSPVLTLEEDEFNPKSQKVKLVVGMPVICHKNNKGRDLLNSQRFVISKITKDEIHLVDGDYNIEIKHSEFHRYFYLAFCVTIHSSQGMTIKEKFTIYDWDKMTKFKDELKLKYVALSRGTCVKNIQIVK